MDAKLIAAANQTADAPHLVPVGAARLLAANLAADAPLVTAAVCVADPMLCARHFAAEIFAKRTATVAAICHCTWLTTPNRTAITT